MALGKSLDNILENYFGENTMGIQSEIKVNPVSDSKLEEVGIEEILVNNPYQTREYFDEEKIDQLAKDIKENGLIQPIVVLKKFNLNYNKPYTLLVGERRLRACKKLGWSTIPALIRQNDALTSKQQSMVTVMENLQREDLSPLELSKTFVLLMKTHETDEIGLAQILNKSLQYVKNYLRLLQLDKSVQSKLAKKELTESQARFLVGLEPSEQKKLATLIIEKDLTVKEIVALLASKKPVAKPESNKPEPKTIGHNLPSEYVKKAAKLGEQIPGSQLKCFGDDKKGRIVISW